MYNFLTVLIATLIVSQGAVAGVVGEDIMEIVIATDVDYNTMRASMNYFKGSAESCNTTCQNLAIEHARRQIGITIERADKIFRRDLGITLKIGYQHFWLSDKDADYPYKNLVGTYESFNKLKLYLNRPDNVFAGHKYGLLHLFTNSISWTGNTVGVADLGRSCGRGGLSISPGMWFSPTVDLPPSLDVFAHEVGHVLGASHKQCSGGMMCSTTKDGFNFMSRGSAEQIWARTAALGTNSCFTTRSDLTPRSQIISAPTLGVYLKEKTHSLELKWKPYPYAIKSPVRYALYKSEGQYHAKPAPCTGQLLSDTLPVKSKGKVKASYMDSNLASGPLYFYSMRGIAADGSLGECTETIIGWRP